MWCGTWVMCCHLTPNTFNVLPETSRHTKQYSGCTKPTPWRPPGSTCQALESATHCSLACQPGGRCWCCTRWFAGFVAGTVEGGVHVGPHADVFGGRAAEGDFTSRRRRNWRTGTVDEACPAALPAQYVRSGAASQVSLQLPKCVRACCWVVGARCSEARGPLTSCACVQTSRKQRWAATPFIARQFSDTSSSP